MKDGNETAFDAMLRATDDSTGPEILAEIIAELREGIAAGTSDAELALILWSRLARVVAIVGGEATESAAVTLGRKGGLSGGRARAEKLSPDRRSEIARLAAQARWKKAKTGDETE